MVVAAVLVLVVGSVGFVVGRHRSSEGAVAAISVPAGIEPGTNRRLARELADRTLDAVPLPSGAHREKFFRSSGLTAPESDPGLTRTAHWRVPTGAARLRAFYRARVAAPKITGRMVSWEPILSTAYSTAPRVVLQYSKDGHGSTSIRIDVLIAARADRTAQTLAPATVTSVVVSGVPANAGASIGPFVDVTVTDRSDVTALVEAFDRLPGAVTGTSIGCPALPSGSPTFRITFRWPDHVLTLVDTGIACVTGSALVLDGVQLETRVDDAGAAGRVVQALVRAALSRS